MKISLKKGWNLVSFKTSDLSAITFNENIIEIKNEQDSWNRNIPQVFNTLNEIDMTKGYFIFSKDETTIEYSPEKITNEGSDFIKKLLKNNVYNETCLIKEITKKYGRETQKVQFPLVFYDNIKNNKKNKNNNTNSLITLVKNNAIDNDVKDKVVQSTPIDLDDWDIIE